MKITIEEEYSLYQGVAGAAIVAVMNQIEGRKVWLKNPARLKFETTEHNLRLFRARMPAAEYKDLRKPKSFLARMKTGKGLFDQSKLEEIFTDPYKSKPIVWEDENHEMSPDDEVWPFKLEPYGYQMFGFRKLRDIPHHAIFAAPGTGKTKMFIDINCRRFVKKQIKCIVILSWPKGVHHQWIDQECPKHIWDKIDWVGDSWDGKKIDEKIFKNDGKLKIFSGNIEMVKSKAGMKELEFLFKKYKGQISFCIDESQTIKNPESSRSKKIISLAHESFEELIDGANYLCQAAKFRTIMTGTPIARDLRDEWGQFMFLDPDIIGIRYKTAFQSMYCAMGGYDNGSVVQHRNVDHFKELVAPYQFRVSKAPLGLPPMVYDEVVFDMTMEQRKMQDELKKSFIAMLDNGEIVSVKNAASMIMRIQQIASGYAVDENGLIHPLKQNPRLDALEKLIGGIDGKKIVWCRFKQDIETIRKVYGERSMDYYGPTKDADRKLAVQRFTDPDDPLEILVASPAAAGAGLNLQGSCHHAIFYTNSFNFIDREQAESRIHRIGTKSTVFNFDLIARGSVDRKILNNLRRKRDFSDFVLDDFRRIVDEI